MNTSKEMRFKYKFDYWKNEYFVNEKLQLYNSIRHILHFGRYNKYPTNFVHFSYKFHRKATEIHSLIISLPSKLVEWKSVVVEVVWWGEQKGKREKEKKWSIKSGATSGAMKLVGNITEASCSTRGVSRATGQAISCFSLFLIPRNASNASAR